MIVRPALRSDAADLTRLLNQIIAIGGTTAHENAFSEEYFTESYILGPEVICCHVAEDNNRLLGFQALDRAAGLAQGWGDIGTFVDPGQQRGGVGAALFKATLAAAKRSGLKVINATIRADNTSGLGYYRRRGFVEYHVDPDFRLKNGLKVGRISKQFVVE